MPSFWSGKSVLITGHTGFKGAWLGWLLVKLGATVNGYALPPVESRPNLFRALRLEAEMHSTFGDIRDEMSLRAKLEAACPDIIFHLAAQALVRPSYENPHETFDVNVLGTSLLLREIRKTSTAAIVVVTSDKCYRSTASGRAYTEDDALGGADPYSASKAAQELVCSSYRASFFADGPYLATVRAGNVIGGGDWSTDRLVPDIVSALQSQTQLVLRYPDAVRPWQHVLEPLFGYLTVGEHLLKGDASVATAWNIGPRESDHYAVSALVDAFFAAWETPPAWQRSVHHGQPESLVLRLDATRAATRLGIRPRFGIETACSRTALWYRRWAKGADARELCDDDIAAFEQAV